MVNVESTELVEYTTASRLAAVYEQQVERILDAMRTLRDAYTILDDQFKSKHGFSLYTTPNNGRSNLQNVRDERAEQDVEHYLHLDAWRILVEKLSIRKLMSSKRVRQLDELLEKGKVTVDGVEETLPPISPGTIVDVLMSFVNSADDFLKEAIREEYDYWKPHRSYTKYKTNEKHTFKLEKKLIQTFAFTVWKWEGKNSLGGLSHSLQPHLTALDNIMHLLDGKGQVKGYSGPLVDAINLAHHNKQQSAATEYFHAKWFLNGNLHLEFLRQDLLDKFNEICGTNRLAEEPA